MATTTAVRAITPYLNSFSLSVSSLKRSTSTIAARMNACIDPRTTIMSANHDANCLRCLLAVPTSLTARVVSTLSRSAKFPYLYGDRVIFPCMSPGSNSRSQCDWTPPLRVLNIFAELPKNFNSSGDGLHKLVFMDMLGVEVDTEQELFDYYIKTLARAIGSEEEAKKRIYLVSCGRSYGFGAEFDEKVETKLRGYRNVEHVFDDSRYFERKKDPNVQSAVRFIPMNLNYRLDSIFSYHHLSEPNPKWKSDHWLITIKQPDGGFSGNKQVIESCIKILAAVVGSEAAALKNIYIVWCKFPFGFGAEIDRVALNKLRGLPDVLEVLPDFAFDIKESRSNYDQTLCIFPSSCGLRFSRCRLDEEYGSEDWFFSMEEHIGLFSKFGHFPLRCYPNLNDPYLTTYTRRSDCKHWFITMEKPCGKISSLQRRIDYCIRILSTTVGREVKKKIYRIKCVRDCIGFGIEIAEKTSNKLRGKHGVRGVLPDYSINKSYEVRSVHQLTPNTQNHLLGDIFTYHHLSKCYSEGKSDSWLIHIKQPNDGSSTERQIVNFCINMLAEVVGSEQAKKKIYIVWCKAPFGFAARIDEKTSNMLKGLPDVLTVLPDCAFNVTNKYRGALVISPSSFISYGWRSIFYSCLDEVPHHEGLGDEVLVDDKDNSQVKNRQQLDGSPIVF